jgi:hypothetical protein
MGKQTTIKTDIHPHDAQVYMETISFKADQCKAFDGIEHLQNVCHLQAVAMEWWHGKDGTAKELNFGERIALAHSELSEAMEGFRKNLMSDHIEGFTMVEEEFADTIIRICDTAGAMQLRLAQAIEAKLAYNLVRPDHKPEAREAEGGKAF